VAQHFLMSAAARTLSLVDLCDLSEDAAHKMLCEMRWEDTDAAPVCPIAAARRLYLSVSSRVQMQGLPSAVFSDERNLARLPEASVSNSAYGVQPVRQRDQRLEQPSVEPQPRSSCQNRVRLTSQVAMRFDLELRDDHVERGPVRSLAHVALCSRPSTVTSLVGYWQRHLQKEELRQAV